MQSLLKNGCALFAEPGRGRDRALARINQEIQQLLRTTPKVQTMIPSSLRWILLFAVLIVPQVLWATPPATPQPTPGKTWLATVGAQSNDKGRQALAFLPNEIWIHAGDSITWRWDADDVHTVTFLTDGATRPNFGVQPLSSSPATFDGSTSVITPPLVKPATFTVI